MKAIINSQLIDFTLPAFANGEFTSISSEDMKGKWAVLFFYPNDFCFVCPTEIADMASIHDDLKELGIEVYAICPDSHYAHEAWHRTSPSLSNVKFPMLSDCTAKVARSLGVVSPETGIIRSTFLINPEGRFKLAEYHENGVGRDAGELLRKVKLILHK